MKRKTNLFYTSGEDSKFLTFSNYTEALTGNFLSSNVTLFPNSFLCLNIPNITTETKTSFITNILVSAYENKLAVLRDAGHITDINELAILIDYIHDFAVTEEPVLITYKGDITEQDYNGTFTDLICTIDSSKLKTVSYTLSGNGAESIVDTTPNKLHGWYNGETFTGPAAYADVTPLYDDGSYTYYYDNSIEIDIDNESKPDSIRFNIIIPLFNIVNTETGIVLKENSPLGIWFADRTIELTLDGLYGQTWSLAIGSQFKPIPTMQNNYSDVSGSESSAVVYNTFAQVLSRQNVLLDSYEKLWGVINNLTKRIKELEEQIDTNN